MNNKINNVPPTVCLEPSWKSHAHQVECLSPISRLCHLALPRLLSFYLPLSLLKGLVRENRANERQLNREDFHPQHVDDHRLCHRKTAITAKYAWICIPSKILRSHRDRISVSFPVNPHPDGSTPVNRHSKSPIDTTRALIGQTLVLMTLNPFERVAVSLKLVSILFDYSSPPASLVFAIFSCEQILKRPLRNEIKRHFRMELSCKRHLFFCSSI